MTTGGDRHPQIGRPIVTRRSRRELNLFPQSVYDAVRLPAKRRIDAVGTDLDMRTSTAAPTVRVSHMTVAGN